MTFLNRGRVTEGGEVEDGKARVRERASGVSKYRENRVSENRMKIDENRLITE